jgi:hypothetical protein
VWLELLLPKKQLQDFFLLVKEQKSQNTAFKPEVKSKVINLYCFFSRFRLGCIASSNNGREKRTGQTLKASLPVAVDQNWSWPHFLNN